MIVDFKTDCKEFIKVFFGIRIMLHIIFYLNKTAIKKTISFDSLFYFVTLFFIAPVYISHAHCQIV